MSLSSGTRSQTSALSAHAAQTAKSKGATDAVITGRVHMGFAGMDAKRETTLAEIEAQNRAGNQERDEERYLERVKAKATAMAKEIVTRARAEAKTLRAEALEEGYQEGLAVAQNELAAAHQTMSDELAQTLAQINTGCQAVWGDHREDVALLTRMALEKILGLELDARRAEVLTALLDEAMHQMTERKGFSVRVNPEDEEAVRALLSDAAQRRLGLGNFIVSPDPAMHPGGLIIESGSGMVDNAMDGRRDLILSILDDLCLTTRDRPQGLASPDPRQAREQAAGPAQPAPQELSLDLAQQETPPAPPMPQEQVDDGLPDASMLGEIFPEAPLPEDEPAGDAAAENEFPEEIP